eukprot:12541194-Alexandrium_andersonii.AAC.1
MSVVNLPTKLRDVCSTCKGGLHHWAPPCGSWVCLNRHTSQRSEGKPLGENTGYVLDQNFLVARV